MSTAMQPSEFTLDGGGGARTREVSRYDPAIPATAAASLPGGEFLPAGAGFLSIELKVRFLPPLHAAGDPIEVHGQVLRAGSRIAFAEAHARKAAGELVGHATTSIALTRARADSTAGDGIPINRSRKGTQAHEIA